MANQQDVATQQRRSASRTSLSGSVMTSDSSTCVATAGSGGTSRGQAATRTGGARG
jgi:hypothetical protein